METKGEVYIMKDWHLLDIACMFVILWYSFLHYFETLLTWGKILFAKYSRWLHFICCELWDPKALILKELA